MSLKEKLKHEIKAVTLAALFFGGWIAGLLLLKEILLAEYDIAFQGWSAALVGALILSKVVLILERFSFGDWIRAQPAWVDVAFRTTLYGAGVLVVLMLEKGLEGRHDHGGFAPAVVAAFRTTDAPHLWANVLCISGALLAYNVLCVVRRHLGDGALVALFLQPPRPGQTRTETLAANRCNDDKEPRESLRSPRR